MARHDTVWLTPLTFAAVTLGGTALALGVRAVVRAGEPIPEELPWEPVDIERAMPTLRDFPMGWYVDDVASIQDFSDPSSSNPSFFLAWKILRLNSPSNLCDPACSWVAAWAASNSFGVTSSGWMPFYSRDDALDFIESKHDEVS